MQGRANVLALLLLPLAMTACGGAERPAAEQTSAPETEAVAALFATSPSDTPPPRLCEPGAERPCRIYHAELGRVFCNPSRQFCRADGYGWLSCGAPAEAPLPAPAEAPPASTEAPDAGSETTPDLR